MPRKLRLSTSHLSRSNVLTLKVFLGLTKADGVMEWEYTDDLEAAMALLIDTDSEEGKLQLEDCLRKNRHQILIALSSRPQDFPENILVLPRPLRSAEVIPILQQAGKRFLNSSQAQNEQNSFQADQSNSLAKKTDKIISSPSKTHRVLDVLCGNRNKTLKIVGRTARPVIFDMKHRHYYATNIIQIGDGLLVSPAESVQIEELQDHQFAKAIQDLEAQDLDILLWKTVLTVSRGQLFDSLSLTESYRLNRWPDLKKLGQNSLHLKLTALLRRGGSIDYFAGFISAGIEGVIDFVNACHALDYLEHQEKSVAPKMALEQKPSDTSKRGLFSRIRSRLGI